MHITVDTSNHGTCCYCDDSARFHVKHEGTAAVFEYRVCPLHLPYVDGTLSGAGHAAVTRAILATREEETTNRKWHREMRDIFASVSWDVDRAGRRMSQELAGHEGRWCSRDPFASTLSPEEPTGA